MRYTEKRNGKNVIPLRNAVCGVDLPKWSIDYHSDVQAFLSGDAVDRLAEIEDKIENGTLVELPIAYGTELHFLYSREHYGKPQPACVHSTRKWIFNIGYDGKMWFSVAGRGIGYYGDYTHELGKTVFLTREEAEKRLKELQNG